MYYQSFEEVREVLKSCGNILEAAVSSGVEPLQTVGETWRVGVTHPGLELLQGLFFATRKEDERESSSKNGESNTH